MYSYEDWLRAVRLYIKLGKQIGLTIRPLGYPTTAALTWYCDIAAKRRKSSTADTSASLPR